MDVVAKIVFKRLPQDALHNGFLGTEKIFQKVELLVSMGSLTLNLVNPAQNKCKKRKKSRELDEI